MEQNDNMNESESLALIQRMVRTAQQGVHDNGFFYLLWGWLVFAAALFNWVMIHFLQSEFGQLGWAVLMPLGGVASMIYGWKVERKKKVVTYADNVLNYVVIAFLVSLFMVLICGGIHLGWAKTYAFVLMVYGTWLFISGGVLKFRPLLLGGIINWIAAIAAFWITSYHIVLLLAVAVLLGYVIPGHLLRNAWKKENNNGI